jgi:acyl-coenzyme A synthetase/AMP-(fatty) acid ligase/3-hydroxymyristoyl/3-hydroxydecanoyl-(acyl carrier protein) dehydratase
VSAPAYSPFAGLSADHVVALGGDGPRTFAALCADAQRLAALLPPAAQLGARRSGILIACADRYAFGVALLAAWARGHAAALPPSHRPAALAELVAEGQIAATVHDGEAALGGIVPALRGGTMSVGIDLRDVLAAATAAPPHTKVAVPAPIAAAAHVVTLYTSGSTGAAERIDKSAAQLLGEVEVLAGCFGSGIERVLCTVPPRHIYGLLFGLLLPLRAGAAFLRETPLHTDACLQLARRHEADSFVGVPAHLQGLSSVSRAELAGLRRVFSSGSPLLPAAFEDLSERLGLSVCEVLGSTETGGIGHRRAAFDPFTPFPDVRVQSGPDGRLLLHSPRLAPELPQPHPCEDRVEVLPSGAFTHLGRAGDVVKVGGTRVSLAEIEQRVRALPGVTDAAAIARELSGPRGHEILLAVAGGGYHVESMRSALSAWLPQVALPRRYRFVDALPREATGKLRREMLLALFEGTAGAEIEWGARRREGDRLLVELRVPAGLAYFRGHFEGWPVLPGVAQLGVIAVREALAAWPELRALRRVRQLKFKRPIGPDQVLALELVRKEDARVDFSIVRDAELCSSGSLIFAPGQLP